MSRQEAYQLILKSFYKFLFLALIITIPVIAVRTDIMVIGNNIGEQSVTEAIQQIFLACSLGIFWKITRTNKEFAHFGFLVCGFFACMLLRELDSYFDDILPGSWRGPVIATALYCIYKATRNVDNCLNAFARFTQSQHFFALSLGLCLLLVFSRLVGMSSLWHVLLGPDLGAVKSTIEECTELLAYTVILYSSYQYLLEFKALKAVKPSKVQKMEDSNHTFTTQKRSGI